MGGTFGAPRGLLFWVLDLNREPWMSNRLALLLLTGLGFTTQAADAVKPREALKPFNDLVGSWRGTGYPEGSAAEKQKGFWSEKIAWAWQFKGDDVWMKVTFDKGKHFRAGD